MRKKIEWNKVTWYSRILALVLFMGLPVIGFYLGTQYEKSISYSETLRLQSLQNIFASPRYNEAPVRMSSTHVPVNVPWVVQSLDTSGWKSYKDVGSGLSYKYPSDWTNKKEIAESPSATHYFVLSSKADSGTKIYIVPMTFANENIMNDVLLFRGNASFHGAIQPFHMNALYGFSETYTRAQYNAQDEVDWKAKEYFVGTDAKKGAGASLVLIVSGASSPADELTARRVFESVFGTLEL